jgi:hypothetical protein
LTLIPGVQRYDLKAWAEAEGITGGIEVKQVFYQSPPAVSQLYSPFIGSSVGGLGGVPAPVLLTHYYSNKVIEVAT